MTRAPMCGHAGPAAAVSFLLMWTAMMVAMMLPSFGPTLWRYQQAIRRTGETHIARPSALLGAGYFLVWTAIGLAALPASVVMTALARTVPCAVGAIIVIAGAFQFTTWKTRLLGCCRFASGCGRASWRDGLRLGLHCGGCCAGFTAILLAAGAMDLRAMAGLTAAITIERWSPAGAYAARAIGAGAIATGLLLIVR